MRGPARGILSVLAVALLLGSALVSVLAVPAAGFGETAIDSNTVVPGSDPYLLVYSGQSVAQSFTASQSYLLKSVALRLRNDGGLSDTLNVTIRPDASGVPSNTVLAWANPLVGGSLGPVTVSLTPSQMLTTGTVYWIVATKGGSASDAYEWHHSGSDTYAGGQAMVNTSGSWVLPGSPRDMWFVTYGVLLPVNVTIGMTAAPNAALPKSFVNLTVYVNNTGLQASPSVWVNVTLSPWLEYVSDTSDSVPAATGYPNYTFNDVPNGVESFVITATVATNTTPGSVLTSVGTVAFTNATGALGPIRAATASVTVGLQWKQLYLLPTTPGATQSLTPSPPTNGTQITYTLQRNGASIDFELVPALARTFRALNITAVLYLDSQSHSSRNLDMNFTLFDVSGAMQTTVAYFQMRVTTDGGVGFQKFTFPFSAVNLTFSAGHQILLRIRAMSSGSDSAVLAMNATATSSQMDVLTTTYVRVDALKLRDRTGVATLWSPKDPLTVTANVSDPFGSPEVAGAWMNLTDAWGIPVLTLAPMTLQATDPSPVSAWKLYSRTYGPPLANGTYEVEVMVEEGNGVLAYATGSIQVSAPQMSLAIVPSVTSTLSGDILAYRIWYNNTGSGLAGYVWVNATLPAQVTFLGSSADSNLTGPTRWTFSNVTPGAHYFDVYVQVKANIPPAPSMTATASLNVADAKGYPWPRLSATAGVVLRGPIVGLSLALATRNLHRNETFPLLITLNNTGDRAATLWLNLTLPASIQYENDTGNSHGGSTTMTSTGVSLRFANLTGGTSWTITVNLTTASGLDRGTNLTIFADVNYTNARGAMMPSRNTETTIRIIAPEIVNASLTLGKSVGTPGDVVPAYLNFTNDGDEAALGIVVTLSLNPFLTFMNSNPSGTTGSNTVTFTFSNVGLTTKRIYLNLTMSRMVADGTALNISGTLVFEDQATNLLPVITFASPSVVAMAPVLGAAVTPASPKVEVGLTYLFQVSVRNTGSGIARDGWLNITLPAAFLYVPESGDSSPTVVGNQLSWHWSNLLPSVKSFTLALSVVPSATNTTNATLSLYAECTDLNGNLRPVTTTVVQPSVIGPTILVSLTVEPNRIPTLAQFDYTIRIQNAGEGIAKTVWVVDSLDSDLQMLRYASDVPASGAQSLNWTYSTLQPHENRTITLFVQVNSGVPVGTNITNKITVMYTNSNGTIVGFAQSLPVYVIVITPSSPLPYVLPVLAIVGAGATYIVYRKRRSRIEEVFLVTREGILVDHMSRNLVVDKDPDIVGGMLTGIQQFVRDAFKVGKDRVLHRIEFGDYHVLIERGEHLYLAVVTSGGDGFGTGRRLRKVIAQIEKLYGSSLQHWDGDMERILGPKELIRRELLA